MEIRFVNGSKIAQRKTVRMKLAPEKPLLSSCSNAVCTARRPEEALDAGGDSVPGTSLYHIPGQPLHSQDNLVISGTFIMV